MNIGMCPGHVNWLTSCPTTQVSRPRFLPQACQRFFVPCTPPSRALAPSNRARHAQVDETSKRTKQYFWVITWKTFQQGVGHTLHQGSEVMSPVPVPSTLFGLHATDQTSAESPFAGPTQFAYGAPHEMRMKDPYPAPHQPTVSNPEYRRIHNLFFLA